MNTITANPDALLTARVRDIERDTLFAASVGLTLARVLGMPMIRVGAEKGRYRTPGGTATPAALARTVARLIASGEA